jgi:membrane protein DedA with SNARE-associated domain
MNQFILDAIAQGGYLGLFFLMALENIFPPIPSEVIMGYAGVLVARGEMSFWPAWIIGTLGTLAGNYVWYWLGFRWTEPQLHGFITRYGRWLTFEWSEFESAREKFRRYGDWIVFLLRFSPFLRTIVSLPAGLARMPHGRFLLFTFLGSLIWNGMLIGGGAALADMIARYEDLAELAILAFVGGGVIWYLYRVVTWRDNGARSSKTGEQD